VDRRKTKQGARGRRVLGMSQDAIIGKVLGCEVVCRGGEPEIETAIKFAKIIREMAKVLAVDRFSLCRIEIAEDKE
jgi:hypothetical protein